MNLKKLNDQQLNFAARVGSVAAEMGLNPDYAIMVLYGETTFNPEAIADNPEEIDEQIRFSVNFLRDKVLSHRDPHKAAVAYFEGDESPFISSGNMNDLDESTRDRFRNIFQFGDFPTSLLAGTEVEEPDETPQPTEADKQKMEDERIAKERGGAQAVGAVLGSVPSIVRAGKDVVRGGPPRLPVQPSAPAPAAALENLPGGPASSGRVQPPLGAPASGMAQPPMGGTAVQNYGKAFGLGDIEAGRATDMTKQPGGVHDLTTQRRQGLQRVQELFPNQFREDPRFGGLMTPEQRPGPGPRGPTGQIGAGKPPPIAPSPPIVTPPPPKPGGLEQVSKLFTRIAETPAMQSLGRGISRYGGPPAAGFTAFGEASTAADELARKNYPSVVASGLSALGAGMMLNPGTFVPGGILSLAGPAYRTFIEGDESLLPEKFPDKTFLVNKTMR